VTQRRGGAVLGSPIAHSLSPVLHRAAYDALGLTDWTYQAVETPAASLDVVLRELAAAGLVGVSLTMPLKKTVLPMLTDTDVTSLTVGAANTVIFGADGGWRGANTDVPGFVAALRSSGLLATSDPPWVIGAGATAGSALAALAALGHRAVVVIARRPAVAAELGRVAAAVGVELEIRPWGAIGGAAAASLVVSTTPAGATDELAAAIGEPAGGGTLGTLFDVVYAPWPTPLAAAWAGAAGQVIGGIELLIEQAAEQVRLMTGLEPPLAEMRAAGRAAVGATG
jgi:shikimate dehydrogenase